MRYVEGSDLRQLLAEGPLPPERAIGICSDVATALDAAHEQGLVHRDVKPSNILVGADDHVYLGDFGLSRRLDADVPAPGTSLGTIAYVAPEQIRGEPVDGRADCYSLACVLYECLTGEPPFVCPSDTALLFAHLETEPPGYPGLDPVLAKALAKDPGDRYPTCGAMVESARQSLGLGGGRSRRWSLIGVAAAVLVAVLAGVAFVMHRSSGSAADPGGRLVAIDARSGQVGQAIRIGPGPDGVAVGNGQIWATTSDAEVGLWKVDAAGRHAQPFSTDGFPASVRVAGGEVWVGDDAGVQRFAGDSGDRIGQVQTGGHGPLIASRAGRFWAATSDNVYRINRSHHNATPTRITTIRDPAPTNEAHLRWTVSGLAAGPHGVWLVGDASDQRLWRVDRGARDMRPVELGFPPSGVADGAGWVWVTDQFGDRLARIDPATGQITKFIGVGGEPMAVVVAPSGVWVADALDDTVSRIAPGRAVVTKTVHVPFSPTALAVTGHRI